jgi:hypothetical protein
VLGELILSSLLDQTRFLCKKSMLRCPEKHGRRTDRGTILHNIFL